MKTPENFNCLVKPKGCSRVIKAYAGLNIALFMLGIILVLCEHTVLTCVSELSYFNGNGSTDRSSENACGTRE